MKASTPPPPWIHRVALVALVAALGGITGVLLAQSFRKSATASEDPGRGGLPPSRLGALTAAGKRGAAKAGPTPFRETLDLVRTLASLPPDKFPGLLDRELREAKGEDRVAQIAAVWAERDPDGFLAWLRLRPRIIMLGEASYGVGLDSTLLVVLARDDPERAWKAAGELPGKADGRYWTIIHDLLGRDPGAAVSLVRNHRGVVSHTETWEGWHARSPTTALPILNELLPGPAREGLIRSSTIFYSENPSEISSAKEWFAGLQPDLRQLALSELIREEDPFQSRNHENEAALRKAWGVADED